MGLILASTSPYRRALLHRLGVPFEVVDPAVDESAWKSEALEPGQLARTLARAKAAAVAARFPDAIVIGSDQVAVVEGTLLGKPGTPERARDQLLSLQGRVHELLTAVCIIGAGRSAEHLDTTRLAMRPLKPDEIERYVEADRPLDCAGAYKLEERGVALFDSVETADPTAIVGLPLMAVARILRTFGLAVP